MRFHNTLTGRKEDFVPLEEGKVKMYVCGPTVYNFIHIGNARPMIVFDCARRYMEYKGYDVTYVSNFTDVDDKIIARSIEEGISAAEVARKYIAECKKDMEALNVKPATIHPLATEEIPGMIDMISNLIDKGYAYDVNGTVYFRTRKFNGYGKLSHKNLDDLRSGERDIKVTGEDQKEDPLDFVLWKPKKEGEPFWSAPWSDGRPGWHIECSVMAKRYLGDEIDIHAGGEDLIFPHHENEIAQSECANGKPFARYWLHNAFLKIDKVKMSKSLGNFLLVRDIVEKYDPRAVRLFMISAHYRRALNYSKEIMESSVSSLERILNAAERLAALAGKAGEDGGVQDAALLAEMEGFRRGFEAAMDDDLNTADAVTAIFELVRFANTKIDENSPASLVNAALKELEELCMILGLSTERKEDNIEAEVEELIAKRQAARKAKDFKTADAIRDMLLEKGILLEDTREGVKWKKV